VCTDCTSDCFIIGGSVAQTPSACVSCTAESCNSGDDDCTLRGGVVYIYIYVYVYIYIYTYIHIYAYIYTYIHIYIYIYIYMCVFRCSFFYDFVSLFVFNL
jgi:hypothetical protein